MRERHTDRDVTNLNRARWAETALRAFAVETSDPSNFMDNPEEVVGDLLCDLRHYCDAKGLSFTDLLAKGNDHHHAETHGEE